MSRKVKLKPNRRCSSQISSPIPLVAFLFLLRVSFAVQKLFSWGRREVVNSKADKYMVMKET